LESFGAESYNRTILPDRTYLFPLALVVGGWKSFINHVPLGNTGGANVPPLKRMPIPEDIKELIR